MHSAGLSKPIRGITDTKKVKKFNSEVDNHLENILHISVSSQLDVEKNADDEDEEEDIDGVEYLPPCYSRTGKYYEKLNQDLSNEMEALTASNSQNSFSGNMHSDLSTCSEILLKSFDCQGQFSDHVKDFHERDDYITREENINSLVSNDKSSNQKGHINMCSSSPDTDHVVVAKNKNSLESPGVSRSQNMSCHNEKPNGHGVIKSHADVNLHSDTNKKQRNSRKAYILSQADSATVTHKQDKGGAFRTKQQNNSERDFPRSYNEGTAEHVTSSQSAAKARTKINEQQLANSSYIDVNKSTDAPKASLYDRNAELISCLPRVERPPFHHSLFDQKPFEKTNDQSRWVSGISDLPILAPSMNRKVKLPKPVESVIEEHMKFEQMQIIETLPEAPAPHFHGNIYLGTSVEEHVRKSISLPGGERNEYTSTSNYLDRDTVIMPDESDNTTFDKTHSVDSRVYERNYAENLSDYTNKKSPMPDTELENGIIEKQNLRSVVNMETDGRQSNQKNSALHIDGKTDTNVKTHNDGSQRVADFWHRDIRSERYGFGKSSDPSDEHFLESDNGNEMASLSPRKLPVRSDPDGAEVTVESNCSKPNSQNMTDEKIERHHTGLPEGNSCNDTSKIRVSSFEHYAFIPGTNCADSDRNLFLIDTHIKDVGRKINKHAVEHPGTGGESPSVDHKVHNVSCRSSSSEQEVVDMLYGYLEAKDGAIDSHGEPSRTFEVFDPEMDIGAREHHIMSTYGRVSDGENDTDAVKLNADREAEELGSTPPVPTRTYMQFPLSRENPLPPSAFPVNPDMTVPPLISRKARK